jgi:hypothetical protein
MATLQKSLRIPGTINLFGATGVGKTFLGWSLAEVMGYRYLPHISHLDNLQSISLKGLIIDNCAPDRKSHRDIRKRLSFWNINRAVLITRFVIDDYTSYVELTLDEQDWAKVADNLRSIGTFRDIDPTSNLWQLLNPYLQ